VEKEDLSRSQIEKLVQSKGYFLRKAGEYVIPIEILDLQSDLDRCDAIMELLDKLDPRSVTDFTIHKDSSFSRDMIDSMRGLVYSWRRQVRHRMREFAL